jgi:HEAT repeats
MDQEKALMILDKYSPMPDDEQLTEEIVDEYKAAIDYLDNRPPEKRFLKPLFYSLGAFDGWGVYEVTRSLIVSYNKFDVVPLIMEGLKSERNGRRYWSTLLAADFADENLTPLLLETLKDPLEEIRLNSVMALEAIGNPVVINELNEMKVSESDEDVIEAIQEAIQSLKFAK